MNAHQMYSDLQNGGKDDIVGRHSGLVKRIAHHLASRLPPSVQIEDLIQAGMIGLLEASRQFDSGQGASFETYASIRIRGAMVDEMRRTDWAPRSVHRKAREVEKAIQAIEGRTGRDASEAEIAKEMGIDADEYQRIVRDSANAQVYSLDQPISEDGSPRDVAGNVEGPDEALAESGFRRALVEQIGGLPEREKLIMSLYYDDELNQREIGEVLGVSESRVCQIHSQALVRLRSRMADWVD